ncbi:MAG: nucleotidyltransferase family protein [Cyanobacteriota bacterium]
MTTLPRRAQIPIPDAGIAQICQQYHIQRLALFGSVLRDDFKPDSDIDILVEFESGYTPDFAFIEIQDRLSCLLGREVDLNTPEDLSRFFREQVLSEAEFYYGSP